MISTKCTKKRKIFKKLKNVSPDKNQQFLGSIAKLPYTKKISYFKGSGVKYKAYEQ